MKTIYRIGFIVIVVLLVASCGNQPLATTLTPATPTELNVHLPVPTDFVKRGFTVVPTVILTPKAPSAFETPVADVYAEYAEYVKTTMPGKCEYCPPGANEVAEAKLNVDDFMVRIEDLRVAKIGMKLIVEIPDGQKNTLHKTIWHALPFVDGKQLYSVSSGRDYGNSSYEKTIYELPSGTKQVEIQILTGEAYPVRFSLWFLFKER